MRSALKAEKMFGARGWALSSLILYFSDYLLNAATRDAATRHSYYEGILLYWQYTSLLLRGNNTGSLTDPPTLAPTYLL